MKNLLLILVFIFNFAFINASSEIRVKISDGLSDAQLVQKMESSLSALLTEMERAYESKEALDLDAMNLSEDVKASIEMLWENSPFKVAEEMIIEHCLTTGTGYQIRNIPLLMKPTPDSGFTDEEYQEAVVSFDKKGDISSFYLSISINLFMNVVKNNRDITDLRRRELILDYVEQFRTSYNQKDIKFLNQVFSDDALIITGRVITQKTGDGMRLPDKIVYKKQSKTEYLSKLKQVFAANKQIRVAFDEIEVMRHPSNVNFYGVTLHQGYTSDRYHDDGYLFLLWDFTDENAPQIHVRTWQPDQYNGKTLPKDEIFNLNDFDI